MGRFHVIDGIRGYLVVAMLFNHLALHTEGGHTTWNFFNNHILMFLWTGSFFVLISGIVAGLVYAKMLARNQPIVMKALKRAGKLYIYYALAVIIPTFLFIADPEYFWRLRGGMQMVNHHQGNGLLWLLSGLAQEGVAGVLVQYIFYLLIIPPVIHAVLSGYVKAVLLTSFSFWLLVQIGLFDESSIKTFLGAPDKLFILFNPLGWQIIFVSGLVLGALFACKKIELEKIFSSNMRPVFGLACFVAFCVFLLKFGLDLNILPPATVEFLDKIAGNQARSEFSFFLVLQLFSWAYIIGWCLYYSTTNKDQTTAGKIGLVMHKFWCWKPFQILGKDALNVFVFHLVPFHIVLLYGHLVWDHTKYKVIASSYVYLFAALTLFTPLLLRKFKSQLMILFEGFRGKLRLKYSIGSPSI